MAFIETRVEVLITQRPRLLCNITDVFESLNVDELVNHGEKPPQSAQIFFRNCNLFFSLNYLASTINAFNSGPGNVYVTFWFHPSTMN